MDITGALVAAWLVMVVILLITAVSILSGGQWWTKVFVCWLVAAGILTLLSVLGILGRFLCL